MAAAGKDGVVQVVPPFTVRKTNDPSAVTVTHSDVEGQLMELSQLAEAGNIWIAHLAPPSVVAYMLAGPPLSSPWPYSPVTKHTSADGHEIPVVAVKLVLG